MCGSCLKAIRRLQRFGHLPSDASVFKSYAVEGNFSDVRLAALEALVDFTAGLFASFTLCIHSCRDLLNYNNNINDTICATVIVAQNHCESSPGSYDEYGTAPSGRRPQTRPNYLGCESSCRLPEVTPTITIYYYCSAGELILILPSHGG